MFKQTKAYTSMRNKLVAALAMLLVASIMMVSSSYAWFTLSTAPEVTGIQTTVGSNGSLEIALSPASGKTEEITTGVGDSLELLPVRNITWGNLVDLSDPTYGLGAISLKPSKYVEGTNTLLANPLSYPHYGADGRITQLGSDTTFGVYNTANENFAKSPFFGVRAIGSSQSMSAQQAGLEAGIAGVSAGREAAREKMNKTLTANGAVLADMMIDKQLNEAEDFKEYVPSIGALITGLEESVVFVGNGLKSSIKAYLASTQAGLQDETIYKAVAALVDEKDLSFWMTDYVETAGITSEQHAAIKTALSDESNPFKSAYDKYAQMKGDLADCRTQYGNLPTDGTTSVDWDSIYKVLNPLVNTESILICDLTVSQVKENMQTLIEAVTGGSGLTVTLEPGSGLFTDMAELVGDYSADITLKDIKYGTLTVPNLQAKMSTTVIGNDTDAGQITSPYMVALHGVVKLLTASNAEASEVILSDYYGYIIDLFFRTNAEESKLMLQTEAADRIYDENTGLNTSTQGGGANMTFTVPTTTTDAQMKAVVGAIRVKFFNPVDGSVLKEARLDANNIRSVTIDGATYKQADLVIWDTTLGQKAESQEITVLPQNTPTAVSVMVYLDGEGLTNADVANAAQSLTGNLNLQFSSNADLKPMSYAPLKNQTNTPDATTPSEPAPSEPVEP